MPDSPRASQSPNITVISREPTRRTEAPPGALPADWTSFPDVMGQLPAVCADQDVFTFRISSAPLELDFRRDDTWVVTKGFGDLIINRITLGRSNRFVLRIEGTTRQEEDVAIRGWYEMNGEVHEFGPGAPGEIVEVAITHAVSCSNCLEYLAFTVVAEPPSGAAYVYDPTLLLAPKKGQCGGNQ